MAALSAAPSRECAADRNLVLTSGQCDVVFTALCAEPFVVRGVAHGHDLAHTRSQLMMLRPRLCRREQHRTENDMLKGVDSPLTHTQKWFSTAPTTA